MKLLRDGRVQLKILILNMGAQHITFNKAIKGLVWFELLNNDAIKITLKRKNHVKALLKKLKADNCVNERNHNELYPTSTRIGILYGLPKIHKLSIPLRPILSSVNHYSYRIAKFFIPFLTPISTSSLVIRTPSHSFKNSWTVTSIQMMWLWPALMLPHCLPTLLSMKQLRSSQTKCLPTACILKALIAHNSSNFYFLL